MEDRDEILGSLKTLLLNPERVGSYGRKWYSLIAREGPIVLIQKASYGDPDEDRSLSVHYYIRDMGKPTGERTILTFNNPLDLDDVFTHFDRIVWRSGLRGELGGPWKCYYCETTFHTRRAVLDHLGMDHSILPKCCKDRD